MLIDWDSATIKVSVPVHHTASAERQEFELPIKAFATFLLTQAPSDWFAKPPTSSDLPLFIAPKGK